MIENIMSHGNVREGNKKPATFAGRGLFDWCTNGCTNRRTKFLTLEMYYLYVTLFEIVKQNLYTQKPEFFFGANYHLEGVQNEK